MKAIILWLVLFTVPCFGQNMKSVKTIKKLDQFTNTSKLNTEIFYDKVSGEKVPSLEVEKFINAHPEISLEREIDKFGNETRIFINQKEPYLYNRKDWSREYKINDYLPEFHLKTIDGEVVDSDSLTSDLYVLNFEMRSHELVFKEERSLELLKIISESKKDITGIWLFGDSRSEIEANLKIDLSEMKIVENHGNFCERFRVTRFPQVYIIDRARKIIVKVRSNGIGELVHYLKE